MAGQAENSRERVQSALDAWRATGDPRFTAFGLNTLSLIAARLGRFDEARAALEESIAINESIGDRWGLGTAYRGLGLIEQEQGRHAAALKAFQKSQSILADLGARWDEARVLTDMGRSIFALGNTAGAEQVWHDAIRLAVESQGTPLVLESIAGIAHVRAKEGRVEQAYELLLAVLAHPASVEETKDRAVKLHAELEARLTREESETIQTHAEAKTFDMVVGKILNTSQDSTLTTAS